MFLEPLFSNLQFPKPGFSKTQPRRGSLSRILLALATLGAMQLSLAQDFIWAEDFPIGASIPAISAQDQDGNLRTFDDLKGERGLLYMLSRSFDW